MSGGTVCRCEESTRPVEARRWVVYQRKCNHSAFNGGHWTPSDYSAVGCEACDALWRTKAAYASVLRDYKLPGARQ